MKKTKFLIEKDLTDKETAIDIDEQTSHLKVSGPTKKPTHSTRYSVDKNKRFFAPSTWQEHSERNLGTASKQIKLSLAVQSSVDGILAQTGSTLKSQKDLTDR